MHVHWLLKAGRLIKEAMEREKNPNNEVQYLSFWGQRKHWTEWRKIWLTEKYLLQKKYGLVKSVIKN